MRPAEIRKGRERQIQGLKLEGPKMKIKNPN